MARALNAPDVLPGQTLRQFENEILRIWIQKGMHGFDRTRQVFTKIRFQDLGASLFENDDPWLEGSDTPIEFPLPPLPVLAKASTLKPDSPTTPTD
jgi:hypothetical protein